MTDFSAIARQAAGQAKKPPRLPPENYPGIIKNWAWGDQNKNKTPYVRVFLAPTDFPENLPEQWEEFDEEDQKTSLVNRSDIDLSKRQMSKDFYMTEDSRWRMDAFLKEMGVNVGTPESPRSYEDTLPELIGLPVLFEVQHQLNQTTNKTFVQVGKLAPLN